MPTTKEKLLNKLLSLVQISWKLLEENRNANATLSQQYSDRSYLQTDAEMLLTQLQQFCLEAIPININMKDGSHRLAIRFCDVDYDRGHIRFDLLGQTGCAAEASLPDIEHLEIGTSH